MSASSSISGLSAVAAAEKPAAVEKPPAAAAEKPPAAAEKPTAAPKPVPADKPGAIRPTLSSTGGSSTSGPTSPVAAVAPKPKQVAEKPAAATEKPVAPAGTAPAGGELVKGLFNFTPENEDELGFRKGEIITVLKHIDEGWWHGELNGRKGIFPSNYVGPL